MKEINWSNITSDELVIKLIKQREGLSEIIRELDPNALIKYELEILNLD